MKHFDAIVKHMINKHKDPNTQYSPTQMFESANELSFAIARLMDAQYTFLGDTFENDAITPELSALWLSIRDEMPIQTASDLALCIIKNTPFSNTQEQTEEIKDLFYTTLHTFTDNADLAQAFTDTFFGEIESKKLNMKAF